MLSEIAQTDVNEPAQVWHYLIEQLENERRRIFDEMVHYPPPIPRCDAQYNYLLEERGRLAEEIHRLDALSRAELGRETQMQSIDEFIRSSNDLSAEARQRARSLL